MNECLIIPCSARKTVQTEPVRAIDLFDGVLARVVRNRAPGIDVFILSAKYGLISQDELIETYEMSPAEVVNREFVVEKVAKHWLAITDGHPDKYNTIWHMTRGVTYKAIKVLEGWTTLTHIIPEDVPKRGNVGIMLKHLKAFCVARPAYSDIDLNHLVTMYKQAQDEGKV